jgi:SAM-dependent methyltransferase
MADSVSRFDNRADDYAKSRPAYPAEAIDAVLEGLGFEALLTVADVGAGTGISSRLIADRGALVVAVEPNAAMRAKAEPHARVVWQDGTAEATGLRDGSVNLVVCAQAFHWFDRERALAEFRRVLRPTGRVALLWNEVDTRDPLAAVYRRVVDDEAEADTPRRRHAAQIEPFEGDALFDGVERRSFAYEQIVTADGLVSRALSASYAPKAGPRHDRMVAALRTAHAAHAGPDGKAALRYETVVWTAGVRPS